MFHTMKYKDWLTCLNWFILLGPYSNLILFSLLRYRLWAELHPSHGVHFTRYPLLFRLVFHVRSCLSFHCQTTFVFFFSGTTYTLPTFRFFSSLFFFCKLNRHWGLLVLALFVLKKSQKGYTLLFNFCCVTIGAFSFYNMVHRHWVDKSVQNCKIS